MSLYAVEVSGLSYRYKGSSLAALDDFALQVPTGSFFGLLGPNGAGKTTFLNLLTGILHDKNSPIRIFGIPARDHSFKRSRLGYVPQEIALHLTLTARENLRFFARLARVRQEKAKIAEVLQATALADTADNMPINHYSGGMKRRLNLAVALLGEPDLLVLDEPTTGIDLQSRQLIVKKLLELKERGVTLIYTSHHLEEIEKLCDHVAIMDHGRILEEGRTGTLLQQSKKVFYHIHFARELNHDERALLARHGHVTGLSGPSIHLVTASTVEVMDVIADCIHHQLPLEGFAKKVETLEDRFLGLTGHAARDG